MLKRLVVPVVVGTVLTRTGTNVEECGVTHHEEHRIRQADVEEVVWGRPCRRIVVQDEGSVVGRGRTVR